MSRSASPRQAQEALPILEVEDFPLPEPKPEPQPEAIPAPPEALEVIEDSSHSFREGLWENQKSFFSISIIIGSLPC